MKILVTCPPMLGMKEQFIPLLERKGYEVICPDFVQVMSEDALCEILPSVDGWIIGDDPATSRVLEAGKAGKLKAAVRWGIGVDNVDFDACKRLGIPIDNTPNMFGAEVADVGVGYVIALARETFYIDRQVRNGAWPKNRGISLQGKTVGVVGYGDIGKNTATRLAALEMNVVVYDPGVTSVECGSLSVWPQALDSCDFLIFTCALNKHNRYMLDASSLALCKDGVRIVNVARGPLINENDLCASLESGKVHSVALDVFEVEPLPAGSYLRAHPLCVFGTHNSSNTEDAVAKTNLKAIEKLLKFLER